MSQQDEGDGPQSGTHRIRRERGKVLLYEIGIALHLGHDAGIEILQTPTCHHRIKAQDNHRGKDTHVADNAPGLAVRKILVRPCRIGCRMTADNKLCHHAGNAQHKDAHEIDKNEGCATILPCHIGKAPYIAQAHCRSCRSKDHTQLAAKAASAVFHFLSFLYG